jgi:hypothetical protein
LLYGGCEGAQGLVTCSHFDFSLPRHLSVAATLNAIIAATLNAIIAAILAGGAAAGEREREKKRT